MKRGIIISFAILASLALGYWMGQKKYFSESTANNFNSTILENDSTGQESPSEDFDEFLNRFMNDSLFQLDRITFPLITFRLSENLAELDSTTLDRTKWRIIRLFADEEYRPQIYDNYEGQLRNTNERMFCWLGIENGIYVEYKFKLINGLWYLIEYSDLST